MSKDRFERYPKTDKYKIIDTLGVPHMYCVTHKHVEYSTKHTGGVLTEGMIDAMEKEAGQGCCGIEGCLRTREEHETAVVVEVDFDGDIRDAPELQEYLESCLLMMELDRYDGFAFIQKDNADENTRGTSTIES